MVDDAERTRDDTAGQEPADAGAIEGNHCRADDAGHGRGGQDTGRAGDVVPAPVDRWRRR
ncbi:hypothetical protein ATM97_25805 [Nocardia sp. MH4]|nr:hypothetical protein [Nocardia sp. MH4]